MKRPAGAGSMATTTTATPAEAAARVHVVVPHHQSTTTTTTTTKNSAISSLQNPRSLVAELQTVLQASRLEWTQWATHERRRCDAAVQQHAHTVSQLQSTIDATQENVLAHQLQHKLHIADSTAATTTSIPQEGTTTKNDNNDATSEHENDTNKENHPTDQDTNRSSSQDADLTDEILGLKGSLSAQKTRLQGTSCGQSPLDRLKRDLVLSQHFLFPNQSVFPLLILVLVVFLELHQEATQEEARTVESREIRSEAQASAQATLTQLRKASRPYQQFLGLDFEKAPNDQLRYEHVEFGSFSLSLVHSMVCPCLFVVLTNAHLVLLLSLV